MLRSAPPATFCDREVAGSSRRGFGTWGAAVLLGLAPILASPACTAPEEAPLVEPDPWTVRDLRQIVPDPSLPPEIATQDANNNLDVSRHGDRVFLAFRAAPSHFASAEAKLHVVSSVDEVHWLWEGTFHLGTDLREPRLLSHDGELHLYFAVLGEDASDFEPQGMMATRRLGPGEWTEPRWFGGEGFIPWRVRKVDGRAQLLCYRGGENIYDAGPPEPIEVHWLVSDDGEEWAPFVAGQPAVLVGGGSETDLAFQDDGSILAVSRNEAGDDSGWGSLICTAPADDLGRWTCLNDPRKYDSPLVFRHGEGTYLVARRNLSDDGHYDLLRRDLDHAQQTRTYQVDYWQHPKRCSLWRVDPATRSVSFILDLPSRGDTCFASELPLSDRDHVVYNYSSPVDGEDLSWLAGQVGPTNIYRMVVRFD